MQGYCDADRLAPTVKEDVVMAPASWDEHYVIDLCWSSSAPDQAGPVA
jgi:hypothetical protein